MRIEILVDLAPPFPQPSPFFPECCSAHDRVVSPSDFQPNLGVRLQIEPLCRFTLGPSVHCHRHQVRAVFEVAEDDAALFA